MSTQTATMTAQATRSDLVLPGLPGWLDAATLAAATKTANDGELVLAQQTQASVAVAARRDVVAMRAAHTNAASRAVTSVAAYPRTMRALATATVGVAVAPVMTTAIAIPLLATVLGLLGGIPLLVLFGFGIRQEAGKWVAGDLISAWARHVLVPASRYLLFLGIPFALGVIVRQALMATVGA